MNLTLLFVIGGCLLGILQVAVGIGIGLWIRRDSAVRGRSDRRDILEANAIIKRLQTLAEEMSRGVGEHRSHLDKASKLLATECPRDDDSIADLVVDVIGDIVRANQTLQLRLDTAETRLKEQATEIETHISLSLTDPLTGLANRRGFDERLDERMAAWERREESFSLLLLDLDFFKQLNDRYGHLAGDQVLTSVGNALRGAMRKDDLVARYGGEEFAVLLASTSLDQAHQAVERVRDAVTRVVITHDDTALHVTASGGLAVIQSGEEAESLIDRADAALYAAKTGGRNCAYLHDGTSCRPIAGCQLDQPLAADDDTLALEDIEREELPQEEISPELAQTCEELRRYVQERDQREREELASQSHTQ